MHSKAPLPTSADGVLSLAILQVLTEVCVHLRLDPDGSLTTSRVLGAIGGFEQVASAIDPDDAPWLAEARENRILVRARLKRMAPLLSRLARAAAANEA